MNRPAGDGFFYCVFGERQTQHTRARGPPGALLQSGACAETGRDPESETAGGFHLKTSRGPNASVWKAVGGRDHETMCAAFTGSRPAGIRGIPASFSVVSKQ